MNIAKWCITATAVLVPLDAAAQDTTEVVILGVTHSAMLVAESYQPAVFRAYFDRVRPDAICIERAPNEFARGSHYEFTYEIQDIAVPYAREQQIPLCPFDWLPAVEDQKLAFGVNLEELPFLRGPRGYANFTTFEAPEMLERRLFYAESAEDRAGNRAWYAPLPDRPRQDFARRLFLYRTFMQAMRIAKAAREYPGGRVLVVVGSMHKDDLEQILRDQPGVRVTAPTHFGKPSSQEVARHIRTPDLAAIATFNLLGARSLVNNTDWPWLSRVVERLSRDLPGAETDLLQTRLAVLTDRMSPADAAARYRRIRESASSNRRFTWDGVLDRQRLDSFADPFGNLTVRERAMLEEARELMRAGQRAQGERVFAELRAALTPLKAAQLDGYRSGWFDSTTRAAAGGGGTGRP